MSLKTITIIIVVPDIFASTDKNFEILTYMLAELKLLRYQVKKIAVLAEVELDIVRELQDQNKFSDIIILVGNVNNVTIYKSLAKASSQEPGEHVHCLPLAARSFGDNRGDNGHGSGCCNSVVCLQRILVVSEQNVKVLSSPMINGYLKRYREKPTYSKVIKIRNNGENSECLRKISKTMKSVKKLDSILSIQLKSASFEEMVEAERCLRDEFQIVQVVNENPVEDLIYKSKYKHIQKSLEAIEKCLNDYGPEKVFLSFNGGKDCTVLLHLVLTVLNRKFPKFKDSILCLYIKNENAFQEQDKFIEQCRIFYNLEIMTVPKNIKDALKEVLEKKPQMKATFMGSRRTDPYCQNLDVFQMTDSDWPRIMRVSPLLDWHYSDIWDYLLYYKVPYCKLYDMGYTSLGNALNTIRNPSLAYVDTDGKEVYLPAYKMMNEAKERSGRNVMV